MSSNPCIRCGNERVVLKTWEEVIEIYGHTTTITNTEFICPDGDCQKIVDKQLFTQKENKRILENQKAAEKQIRLKRLMRAKRK